MSWQVALILDGETDPGNWIGQMPVWAVATLARRDSAAKLREDWESLWEPEHALTLLNSTVDDNPAESLLDLVPTLEEHHPSMMCVRIFGITDSEPVRLAMASLGYRPISENTGSSIGFARPISEMPDVSELILDAKGWQTADDVFDSFFCAVGAPSWHGRNFNALNDSIATGNINKTGVPYRLVIHNARGMGKNAAVLAGQLDDLIRELQGRGCPVEMRIEQ
jgi:hypothetical protein